MDQETRFEFAVDEQYENEKGVFTVLSINKNEMVIRWENGEEIRTDIELQRNIQARREWEKLQLEKEAKAAKSGRKSGARAAAFEGFKETDFKNSASGTKWRGRYQLGGAVTQKLPEHKYTFNSWAFANKPEMHWLDVAHHKRRSGDSRAKLFLRLDTENMYLGFNVAQPMGDEETTKNWENFMYWLDEEDGATQVHSIALQNEMTVNDKNGSEDTAIIAVKDGWQMADGKKKHAIDKLPEIIGKLGSDGGVNLEIYKRMNKKDALAGGKDIALDVAELFSQLIVVYNASLRSSY